MTALGDWITLRLGDQAAISRVRLFRKPDPNFKSFSYEVWDHSAYASPDKEAQSLELPLGYWILEIGAGGEVQGSLHWVTLFDFERWPGGSFRPSRDKSRDNEWSPERYHSAPMVEVSFKDFPRLPMDNDPELVTLLQGHRSRSALYEGVNQLLRSTGRPASWTRAGSRAGVLEGFHTFRDELDRLAEADQRARSWVLRYAVSGQYCAYLRRGWRPYRLQEHAGGTVPEPPRRY